MISICFENIKLKNVSLSTVIYPSIYTVIPLLSAKFYWYGNGIVIFELGFNHLA